MRAVAVSHVGASGNISYPTHCVGIGTYRKPVGRDCRTCNRRDLVLAFPRVLMESGDAQKRHGLPAVGLGQGA